MLIKDKKFDSPLPAPLAYSSAAAVASCIYTAAVGARNFFYDNIPALSRGLGRPVIGIGGIRAGGVGKTPVAQMIGRHLIDNRGCAVAFLSRGYGRVARRTVVVGPYQEARWEETGDEPCMIHRNIPESWLGIGADRAAAAVALLPSLPERSVFILDDGFQRRQTRRDLDIVCLSESTFDDRMIPRGYLRESISSLARADIIFIIGAADRIDKLREVEERVIDKFARGRYGRSFNTGKTPLANAAPITAVLTQCPDVWVNAATGERVAVDTEPPFKNPAVISGIARPARFINMLRALSVEPSDVRIFADHHIFKKNDFLLDNDVYSVKGAKSVKTVVTTEKDFVRMGSARCLPDGRAMWYLKIKPRFFDAESEARVLSKINEIIVP